MSGNVSAQLPVPELQGSGPDQSRPKASLDREKSGDSQYDRISRQQEERLQRPQGTASEGPREPARRPDASGVDHAAAGKPSTTGEARRAAGADGPRVSPADEPESGEPMLTLAGEAVLPQPPVAAQALFSFADLAPAPARDQPLAALGPMQLGQGTRGLAGGMGSPGQGGPNGLTPAALFAAMLEGDGDAASGSRDLLSQQLASGASSDGKLADLMPATAQGRFSGALELAGQQLNGVAGQRGMEPINTLRGYATSVDVPVASAEWGDKVMGKLAWLTGQNMSVAEIHVTPPDLGPLDVRVQVQNDQATVTVHASTQAVREQLELHGHRLRDMLAQQGIDLEQFDVTDSGAGNHDGEQAPGEGQGSGPVLAGDGDDGAAGESLQQLDLALKGEVDLYA